MDEFSSDTLDQTDEDILTYTVSDEALLEAAGDVPGIYTETGILCPNRTLMTTFTFHANNPRPLKILPELRRQAQFPEERKLPYRYLPEWRTLSYKY